MGLACSGCQSDLQVKHNLTYRRGKMSCASCRECLLMLSASLLASGSTAAGLVGILYLSTDVKSALGLGLMVVACVGWLLIVSWVSLSCIFTRVFFQENLDSTEDWVVVWSDIICCNCVSRLQDGGSEAALGESDVESMSVHSTPGR